jgi:hypothetical protein
MSVQLILYPQNYNGTYSFTSTPILNQYVADGNFNTGINNATSTSNAFPSNYALLNSVAISAWRSFRSTGGTYSSVTPPSITTAGLNLYSNSSTFSSSGVYQLISNLTIGVCYELKITVTGTTGNLTLGNTKQNTWIVNSTLYKNLGGSAVYLGTPTGTLTHQFTAGASQEVLVLDYKNLDGSTIIISNVSITECPASATQVYTDLADGQVICDLYEEEAIPLSLSIDDFKNVAEKTQSYSKDFHLPNTKRNNKIFSHIFEVTRTTDAVSFNPYVKTRAILKEDSYTLFEGFLQLIDINDKESEISYNVNLYSEVITLADTLKESKFYDLDFTELEHDYDITQIQNSWNDSGTGITYNNAGTSGFRDANDTVKYPFIDWAHTFLLTSSNLPELNSLEEAFRPCIQIKYLIDRIFQATPFTFQSNIFDSTDFSKLYMDFNWGADNAPSTSSQTVTAGYYIDYAANYAPNGSYGNLKLTFPSGNLAQVNYSTTTNKITATTNNTQFNISYSYEINILNVAPNPQYSARWLITKVSGATIEVNLVPIQVIAANQIITYFGSLSEILDNGDTLEPQFYSNGINVIVQNYDSISPQPLSTANVTIQKSILNVTSNTLLQTSRGELSQWEFLKGIMTMFNLISISDRDNPNNIILEPYADVFITNSNSTQRNWTDKVDISEINLKPLSELTKKTIFKFVEEDSDYAFNNYKNSVGGHLYGSKIYDASGLTLLTGEEEIIAEPFAATVSKPLMTNLTNFIVPTIYSLNDDGTSEGFENAPRILYNNGVKTLQASNTYKIPAQNGVAAISSETEFLQFSHLTDIPTIVSSPPVATDTRDFHFGECQLINPIGNATINNLYNIYYSPYYDELYHPDTRIMTMKVNLTPADIQNFKFYDTVVVKNREYRVNKIEYKPNTLAKVEFILIP